MDVQSLIECPICCDFLQTVLETPCCHGLFCESCLKDIKSGVCPGCRSRFTLSDCKTNIPIQRFVDNLPLECPYVLNGCGAKPPRSELARHKELCEFQPQRLAQLKQAKMETLNKKKTEILASLDQFLTSPNKSSESTTEMGEKLFELAELLHTEADFKQAIMLCERIHRLLAEIDSDSKPLQLLKAKNLNLHGFLGLKEGMDAEAVLKILNEALAIAEKHQLSDVLVDILVNMGNVHAKKTKFSIATEMYQRALAVVKQTSGVTSIKAAEIFNAMGMVAKKCSEYDRAIQVYKDALKLTPSSNQMYSEIALNLADVYRKKGNYKDARELYSKCLLKFKELHGENHPILADVCNAFGMLEKKEGRYSDALKHYKTALKITQHFFGKDHPNVGMYLTNIGDIYRKEGQYNQAETTYALAIATLQAQLGSSHVEVAEVLNSQGLVLKKRGDYENANQMYKRAMEIVEKTYGPKHYKMGIYGNNLGDTYRKRNQYDQAMKTYEKAHQVIVATLGETHSEAGEILHNMGQVKHTLGDYKTAIQMYEDALRIIRGEFGERHYKVGMFLNSLGLSLAMIKDYDRAYTELKSSLQILTACLGPNHIEVADVHSNLGDVCMKLQAEGSTRSLSGKAVISRIDEAKKYYSEAFRIVKDTFGESHKKSEALSSLLFICENYTALAG